MSEDPRALLPGLLAEPEQFGQLLATADPARVCRVPAPGQWSPAMVVAHLSETEMSIGLRIRSALTQDEPLLSTFDPDAWATLGAYDQRALDHSLALWRLLREDNVKLLERLDDAQWQRACIHPERGRMTVADWARMLVRHDGIHRAQIDRALATP